MPAFKKTVIYKYRHTVIGIMAGAICGYLYYYYKGCANGTCLITSKPLNSMLYGSLMGALFLNIFKKEK